MRVSLFVTALIASSLFGGAALAERPGDDSGSGRTSRIQHVRDLRMHQVREAREVREVRQQETPQTRTREPKITDHLRARGDMIDRTGAKAVAPAKLQADAGIKAQRNADKAQKALTAKQDTVRNCSPTDDSCTGGARSAQAATQAQSDKNAQKQRNDVQKMVDKVRAEKLKAKIMRDMCEKHANTCADNL